MKLQCFHCGAVGSIDDSHVGSTVKCPQCQKSFETFENVLEKDGENRIELECPACHVAGSSSDAFLGRTVKCPECDTLFVVQEDPEDIEVIKPEFLEKDHDMGEPVAQAAPVAQAVEEDDIDSEILHVLDAALPEVPDEPDGQITLSGAEMSQDEAFEKSFAATSAHGINGEASTEKKLDPQEVVTGDGEEELELELGGDSELEIVGEDQGDVSEIAELEVEGEIFSEQEEAPEVSADVDAEEDEFPAEVVVEPYGLEKEQCWQCGKESDGEHFMVLEGRAYCGECIPKKHEPDVDPADPDGLGLAERVAEAAGIGGAGAAAAEKEQAADVGDSDDEIESCHVGEAGAQSQKSKSARVLLVAGAAAVIIAILALWGLGLL
ncbi:hypothetical protein [Desulforhopalus singaporensis]|uniref:MJ0042 family finger-like domain-containing protein n=1 Tax=Desulforhopalus singaporensis TaxID=91360 RepID=A0A1H0L3C6_9BACT|nr:hypothetical protein [Desulforhopalus singaporensis]SDO62585.1 hypothetical protein SAMN05660330_00649 [Desulforhopalus singaporensis]